MPCYQVIKATVVFKVGNIEILKKALERKGYKIKGVSDTAIVFEHKGQWMTIDLTKEKISAEGMRENQLQALVNPIKRAYSETVLDEVAKKNKWLLKKSGENHFQLQRF
jgi:hypothetical protein